MKLATLLRPSGSLALTISTCLPLALASCVDDAADDTQPGDLGETAQEVTSTSLNAYTCQNQYYCNFDLGTAVDRACFFAGLRGGVGLGTYGSYAGIGVDTSTNHFTLTTYPPDQLLPITVTTVCVTHAANRSITHWTTNYQQGAAIKIPNTTSATRCFLSQYDAESGGMTHYNDTIKTWKDAAGAWWIGGSAQTGYVDASAICFDAVDDGSWAWGQGAPGSTTGNLQSNVSGGVACGLVEVGGAFTTNSGSDGVFIDYSARAKQWIWTLVNYKHGGASCIL